MEKLAAKYYTMPHSVVKNDENQMTNRYSLCIIKNMCLSVFSILNDF